MQPIKCVVVPVITVASLPCGNFGLGAVHSETDYDAVDEDPTVTTVYVAYTLPLFDIDNATATFAGSTSSADNVGDDDELNQFRTRFNYTF